MSQGADIALAWISDGTPHLEDCHATGKAEPLLDEQQDWTLLEAKETQSQTIVKMKRPINTGDTDDFCLTVS